MEQQEKKVEYLELIYDLIFVYIIGRNNSLLHHVVDGFVPLGTFAAYALCALSVIQIWNFSTYYINMHGRNGVRDHIFLSVNMYLLYYMGEGVRLHWEYFQNQYHYAWALILCNIGLQYALELRHPHSPMERRSIRRMLAVLFGEAALVLASVPVYNRTGVPLSALPILYGIILTRLFADETKAEMVDFPHLTERAMLFVVFTFGEMVIAIASYFDGAFTLSSVYFSAMSFLIVVGLFVCYEILYDKIIDRTRTTTGISYMIIHIFLIFAMNLMTTSLEFMQNSGVALWPKTVLLLVSFVLYFLCLFALQFYSKPACRLPAKYLAPILALAAAFVAAMLALRELMYWNILLSVVYVGFVCWRVYSFGKQVDS